MNTRSNRNRSVLLAVLSLTLSIGLSAWAARQTILIDFGPNDVTNGDITGSPDYLGQYWNNLVSAGGGAAVPSGIGLANLITTNNSPTTIGVYVSSAGLACNGKLNGGLLYPSYAWLGNFAVTNATEDYFFTTSSGTLTLTNLNPATTYQLRLFGTRETTISRITRYVVTGGNGSFTSDLTTSGTGVGAGGYNGNNNTLATITGVSPNASKEIQIALNIVTGGFAYLGILELTDLNRAPTTTNLAITRVSGLSVNIAKSNLAADPDGDPLTFTIGTTTNGATLTQDSAYIYVPANTVDDQFGFIVDDGSGGTNSGTVTLTVGRVPPTLVSAPTASDIGYGQSLASSTLSGGLVTNLDSAVSVPGTFAFTTPSLTPGAAGPTNVSVTFTPTDTANYNSLTTIVTVQVNGVTPTITDLPAASALSYGQSLASSSLSGGAATNATAGVSVPGTFAFTTPSTVPNAGSAIASVTFTPTDPGYNPVLTTVTVAVSKTIPVLTAPTASGIALGQSLASSTLSGAAATNPLNNASVSGSFAFTTPALIPSAVGPTNVSVTFTPADTANYNSATATTTVNVSAGKLVVFGSSVAKGQGSSPTVFTNSSFVNGYAGLMFNLLAGQGVIVTNASLPGESTANAVNRFASAVIPVSPKYVVIGYSLGNDGLAGTTDPTSGTIVTNFAANILNLVGKCRTNGYQPIVAGVYTRNDYTAGNYAWLKTMHLIMNTWDVPSINFLGTIDDGSGHWVNGYWADSLHPNNAGHAEMFYSFVPSLVEALAAGKTNKPALPAPAHFARLTDNAGVNSPVTYTPSNTVHSFTVSFQVRGTNSGSIAAVRAGSSHGTLEIRTNRFVYVSPTGQEISIVTNANNGQWHDVALACRYALTNTALIVDGVLAGTLAEQFVPDQFILGGSGGAVGRPGTPSSVDLKNWCVYRSAWSTNEAVAQRQGNLQQSSLEICAALDDLTFTVGSPVTNRAQSLSQAVVNTPNLLAIPPANQITSITANGDGTRTVTFTGQSGFSYRLQTAADLATPGWTDAATNAVGDSGVSSFTDTNAAGQSQKFYRTVYP